MSRRDNDSLEDFFRKGTRHPDLEFNEGDWSNLEKRLDAELGTPPPARAQIKLTRAIPAVAFLVLVGGLSLLLWRGHRHDTANLAPEIQTVPQAGLAPADNRQDLTYAPDPEDKFAAGSESPAVPELQAADGSDDVGSDLPEAAVGTTMNKKRIAQPGREIDRHATPDSPEPHAEHGGLSAGEIQHEPGVTTPGNSTSGFNPSRPDPRAPVDEKGDSTPAGTALAGADQPVDSVSAAEPAGAPDNTTTEVAGDRESPEFSGAGRFGISIVIAPDFSMTTGGGAMGPGEAVGIMLHYQAFKRWGITAGALHNTKKYWGHGSEYRPPSGYWKALTNGIVPDRIDGWCAMYEIPISVTFDVVQTRRSRLFVSAGLSSYLMRNEQYDYRFDDPNPGAVTGWSGDKPSELWFGIGTISAGYDFKATRSLSFGVEPYFKVPMEGIGWADVDLYSTGLMFAARYHFMKSGKKHPPPSHGP